MSSHLTDPKTTATAVDAFLEAAHAVPAARTPARGRLIFALDATMSRRPTWDIAQGLQQQMFATAAAHGGLDVQLVYFRGLAECRASRFVSQGEGLSALMAKIDCRGGHTQIEKVLRHAAEEARAAPVGALIYVGDAMEENADALAARAGELALRGVKAFLFHEGGDAGAAACFQDLARVTGGAYARFDASAPHRLAALLGAVAAYAAGGRAALTDRARGGDAAAKLLLEQMD